MRTADNLYRRLFELHGADLDRSNLLIGVKISSTSAVFISETDRPPMRGNAYRSRLRIQFCA